MTSVDSTPECKGFQVNKDHPQPLTFDFGYKFYEN